MAFTASLKKAKMLKIPATKEKWDSFRRARRGGCVVIAPRLKTPLEWREPSRLGVYEQYEFPGLCFR